MEKLNIKKFIDKCVLFWNNKTKGVNVNMKPKISLSSKVEVSEEQVETQQEAKPVEYTSEALGLYRNKFDEWVVGSIRYNGRTGEVSPKLEEVEICGDKELAIERLKVHTVMKGII